jgi:hypothetical protein
MRELMTVEFMAARITVYELEIRQIRTSAFTNSGRSNLLKTSKSKDCKRPEADIPDRWNMA